MTITSPIGFAQGDCLLSESPSVQEDTCAIEEEWCNTGSRIRESLLMLEGVECAVLEDGATPPTIFDLDSYLLVFTLASMKWQELDAADKPRFEALNTLRCFIRSGLLSRHAQDAQAYLTLGHVTEDDTAMLELIKQAKRSLQ